MNRYCLSLDLVDDPALIAAYDAHHAAVWPEVLDSIRNSGILAMEIYRTGNRLFMIMETAAGFSFDAKTEADAANAKVQDWETLMWTYQQQLPGSKPGEKWRLMVRIFSFSV
ncbi:L-fucose mutarotase [Pedobacter yulinensis]|uniref:L-fucose mutarotase n=1 Tax=Pedobacter yulinensis TaxID=2126353 RepID=A0A2T3HKW9_9SPHI|nr:L-rhamnose mutarotase [Pedobacter yulinensis]PST83074.1 L-fucose mutarotase [Pedobacter yulinensis]